MYPLSFVLTIIFGLSNISGTLEFFSSSNNLFDKVFSIILIAVITTLGYWVVKLTSKKNKSSEVFKIESFLLAKSVPVSR